MTTMLLGEVLVCAFIASSVNTQCRSGNLQSRHIDFINHDLKIWVNSPSWLTLFESAQRQREMYSTEWFVDHELVSRWISQKEKDEYPLFRVLWVQGWYIGSHIVYTEFLICT